ncbi:AAA family ATPase [Streptomyces sp. NPDC088707]|uniref:helix-turn-helix transcriptional regulator n=1 Tax=Streptomyces sp. NPDC088707 TaxID=3365871 RepID=UPI00380B618F
MDTPLNRAPTSEENRTVRDRETERLRRIVTARTHQGPWLLEITGDPGMGKTRILEEWSALAGQTGMTVLKGRASAADRGHAFGAFRTPVARALHLPGASAALHAEDRAFLLHHFAGPALTAGPYTAPDGPEADPHTAPDGPETDPHTAPDGPMRRSTLPDRDPHRLRRCIAALLWAVAGDHRGLTLCLDDLQWADPESVALLGALLRRPRPGAPLILVCSVRPRQSPTSLTAHLADPDDAFRVERFRLEPLPRNAAGALLHPATTTERQRYLYEAAEGNPLYLRALSSSPSPFAPADKVLPWTLSDTTLATAGAALARELVLLDAVERDVLRAAAVLGDAFDPAYLADVADQEPANTARALDRLVDMDLVRADLAQGRLCRLRHPVLRTVVYQDAPHGWRRAAHARAHRVLREVGADPARRAPHVARSAEPGDTEAVRLLAEAADQVGGVDPEAAAAWLGIALGLIRNEGDDVRTRVTTSLARALGAVGRLRECRELLRRVPLPSGGRPTEADAELVAFRARVERHLGDYDRADSLLTAVLQRLAETGAETRAGAETGAETGTGAGAETGTGVESGAEAGDAVADSVELGGTLRLELATVSALRQAFPRSRALAESVHRQTTGTRNRPLSFAAAVGLTHCGAFSGDIPTVLHRAREAGALLAAMKDSELTPQLDTVAQLAWAEALAERHHDTLRHTARGIRLAQSGGQIYVLPYLRLAHAYASVSVGRLTDALRSADGAEEEARRMDRPALVGFALALRAWAVSLADGPDAAAPIAERAVQELGAGGRLWAATAGVLADVRFDQGRYGESLDLVRSAMEHERHPGTARSITPIWYSLAARAAAALGDRDQSAEWARRASYDADLLGLPGQRGYAALARSHSAHDPVGPLQEAVSGFRAAGLIPMECRANLLLAAELASSDPQDVHRDPRRSLEQALDYANRAKTSAEALGARRLRREAVDIQRRLGARRPRPARETATPLSDMSDREREITRMVALGMSNNDIARALVISSKTVEAHLTRIFRKVGVRTRTALVATLPKADPATVT